MKLELKNQEFAFGANIHETYPLVWHYGEDRKEKINDLSLEKCSFSGKLAGNITIETKELELSEILDLLRSIGKFHSMRIEKIHERVAGKVCREVTE